VNLRLVIIVLGLVITFISAVIPAVGRVSLLPVGLGLTLLGMALVPGA